MTALCKKNIIIYNQIRIYSYNQIRIYRLIMGIFIFLILLSPANAGEIGFIEQFSLAEDRSIPLKNLLPGTKDYYFYHCFVSSSDWHGRAGAVVAVNLFPCGKQSKIGIID